MSVTGGSVSVRHSAQHRTRARLSPQAYLATTGRILRQLAGDHRSVAMILVVPSLIITLMYFMFKDVPHRPGTPSPFDNACLIMLGVFPLIVMFLITSITMQRERVSGTLERILTTPLRRLDLLAAYGTAFSIAAAAQATLACVISFWLLGLDTAGSPGLVFVIAIINAVLGVGLGLLCSAFARTEFQAVQFMPVVIAPQLLLCGIIVPRDVLPDWLQWISNALPASYALEALQEVGAHPDLTATAARDIAVVVGVRRGGDGPGRGHATAQDAVSGTEPQAPRPTARDLRHPRPHPHQCARTVRPQRYRQHVDPFDRGRRRRRLRAGPPLLRHQGTAVRRGGPHSDRPDAGHRTAARGAGRAARAGAAVAAAAAVGLRDRVGLHRHPALAAGRQTTSA